MALLKIFVIMIGGIINMLFSDKSEKAAIPADATPKGSLHTFKVKNLAETATIDLSKYKGKKVVILNTASKCGFTKQYADWEAFYKKHGDKVVVLGFPANNFASQEPGTNEDIAEFCQLNYGVTFPMFEKVEVIGKDQHKLYQWLSTSKLNGWNDRKPTWNFCKYVVDENGKLTNFFASKILPTDPDFLKAVGIKE